ncbi:MAG: plasmid mobilization relaxosome protein MobC [Oscillospiraceae bacterium]
MEISRIGNNINQIVHLANETKTVTAKDIDMLNRYLREIKKILKDWINSLL